MIAQFNRLTTAAQATAPVIVYPVDGTNNTPVVSNRRDSLMKSLHKMMNR